MGSLPVPTPTDVVEALLFASDTPLEAERIREVLDLADVHEARRLLDELRARYEASSQGLQIVEVGGGYRMITRAEVAPWLVRSASPAGRRRPAGRISSRRPASSWSPSACGTSAICRRSRASWSSRSRRVSPSMAKLRLNKILAQAGLTSRRGGDRLIVDGHVAVNGVVTRSPATLADPVLDEITVDGRPLPPAEAKRYVLLNKPRGYVTSLSDPQGRPVVADLVAREVRLYPVGRLDWDVEGALLLTNDGPLTHRLLHPRYALPRVYEARVEGTVPRSALERWRRGVTLDDGPARPLAIELSRAGTRESHVRLTFAEGRKHEVKRFCEALGHRVLELRRIAFGPLALGALRPGESRSLTAREVSALRAAVAAPRGS